MTTATKWSEYDDCPRLSCPAKSGAPCQDGYYGRALKNPHPSRPRVRACPTCGTCGSTDRAERCGTWGSMHDEMAGPVFYASEPPDAWHGGETPEEGK